MKKKSFKMMIELVNVIKAFFFVDKEVRRVKPGNTKGGSITVPLTSCLTGLDQSVLQTKTKIVSCQLSYS